MALGSGFLCAVVTRACVHVSAVWACVASVSFLLHPVVSRAEIILNYTRYNSEGHRTQLVPHTSIRHIDYLRVCFSASNRANKVSFHLSTSLPEFHSGDQAAGAEGRQQAHDLSTAAFALQRISIMFSKQWDIFNLQACGTLRLRKGSQPSQ